jgi:hypothetical protein
MAIGDIRISSFKVGGLDLTNSQNVFLVGFNVYEDMLNPCGPVAECRVLDHGDALGQSQLKGNEDCEITFSTDGGGSATFKFKLARNKNLNDGSRDKSGSGKAKQYDLRMVSKEMIECQKNHVQKTYKDKQMSQVIEDIHKNNFKSDKQLKKGQTKPGRIQFDREHPIDAVKKLYNRSVSEQKKSSLFCYYHSRSGSNQECRYETFEEAMERSTGLTFKQDATAAATNSEQKAKQNMLWFRPSDGFDAISRGTKASNQTTYNRETGKAHRVQQENKDKFKVLGQEIKNYEDSTQNSDKKPPEYTMHSPSNTKKKEGIAKARVNRASYLSDIAQNAAEFECIGNPKISVGSTIKLDIPNKSSNGGGGREKQFNGEALVVAVRHKIKPAGQTPRYTCVVRVIKAGHDQGGGGMGGI